MYRGQNLSYMPIFIQFPTNRLWSLCTHEKYISITQNRSKHQKYILKELFSPKKQIFLRFHDIPQTGSSRIVSITFKRVKILITSSRQRHHVLYTQVLPPNINERRPLSHNDHQTIHDGGGYEQTIVVLLVRIQDRAISLITNIRMDKQIFSQN